MNFDNIPDKLKQLNIWCVWKRDAERGKIPYNPHTGYNAKSNHPSTFSDFQTAYSAHTSGGYHGIGIGIFNDIGAIDIDNCVVDGVLSDMAQDIIKKMGSYTEYSPSGSGIRIIFIIDGFQYNKDLYYINNHKQGLEVYVSGATRKFVTITGNVINDNPIVDGTSKLTEVLDMYMQRNNTQEQTTSVQSATYPADHFLTIGLEKDDKLKSYWYGARPLASESENDAGLMAKLLYWCNNDTSEAIKAFRSSPYAGQKDEEHKKKLDRSDYLPNLAKAMRCERTAEQENEKWQSEYANRQGSAECKPSKVLNAISAPDLQQADLPSPEYLVHDFLSAGTSILAAPPKFGKSWLVLLMALRIAAGEMFLQWKTKQSGVLYLSFEDSYTRLQRRMNKLLNNSPAPLWLHLSTERVTLDDGLLDYLDEYIKQYPEIKLVIIDTFQKIRGRALPSERWYDHDYRETSAVKEAMDKKGVSVLFVSHTNKTKDKDDPFAEIAGTNGVSGVMDTMFVIKKARNSKQATLHITGRDVEQDEFVICFNEDTCQWEFIGDAEEMTKQEEEFEYQTSPIVKTIKAVLDESLEKRWTGNAKNLLEAGERIFHIPIATSSRNLGNELKKLKDLLYDQDNIVYTISPNGNAGYRHHFRYDVENVIEDDTQDGDDEHVDS